MQKLSAVLMLAAVAMASGCASLDTRTMASAIAAPAAPIEAKPAPVAATAAPVGPAPEKSEGQAMAEIATQLGKLAAADPELHAEVLEQLAGTQPNLWSLAVQRAEHTLAYRRRLAEQRGEAAPVASAAEPSNVVQTTATTPAPLEPPPIAPPQTMPPRTTMAPPRDVAVRAAPVEVIRNAYATGEPTMAAEPVARAPRVAARQVAAEAAPAEPVEPVEKTWREHLAAAIATLDRTAASKPRSKQEAYSRVRLQLLQLAAGETDAAVVSTPGLSSAEQGYWSNQLYALATLLDGRSDPRTTADAAARHQAEASAKLKAMGTLQVHNFVTCKAVYDYGAYEPLPDAQYAPGDQVTLYAEIDNYHSESTAEGHRTTLASAYRLVDRHGDEVAAGDFPEVDDLCLTRRRDFHIEYRVTLPAGLAAGEYTVELTVTDRLGDKIGHSELPLVVALR